MKSFFATALVALGLIATTVSAQAGSYYQDYPEWAQRAFESN